MFFQKSTLNMIHILYICTIFLIKQIAVQKFTCHLLKTEWSMIELFWFDKKINDKHVLHETTDAHKLIHQET